MNFHEIVSQLILDSRGDVARGPWSFSATSSIGLFLPEIALCATIVLMLFVRVFSWGRRIDVLLAGQDGADFSGGLLELLSPSGVVLATAVADPLGFWRQ